MRPENVRADPASHKLLPARKGYVRKRDKPWRGGQGTLGPEAPSESTEDEAAPPPGYTRRRFVRLAAGAGIVAGIFGMGALSGLGIVHRQPEPPPPWEIAPGVVDYSLVPEGQLTGPTPHILKVAQWYDYWPGSFLTDFENYMAGPPYHMDVTVQPEIYTSNEELFEWITLGGKKYDVMFPTNHVVDNIKKAGFIYNLNPDWIPNFSNLWDDFVRVPHHVDSADNLDQRQDPNGLHFVSVPYFFGTTGIAWRKDKIPKDEVEALGLDFFTMSSYTPQALGYSTVTLDGKMRMLEDQRDVLTFGFKKAGWTWQEAGGLSPSPYVEAYQDTLGHAWPGTQWTSNETDGARVSAARDWLFQCKPHLFDFNSTGDTPSLIAGIAVLNQAWSGDIAYAQRPDQSNPQPADFIIPYQGSRWWQDTCVIHSRSRNLWLAHQFVNFIHNVTTPWTENQLLTKWNLYPTPNKACFDLLQPFANGYDMRADPRLYPNLLAPDDWNRCDIPRDVGVDVLVNAYNPLWFDLTSE